MLGVLTLTEHVTLPTKDAQVEVDDKNRRAHAYSIAANVCYGVGGAAAGVGLTWLIVATRPRKSDTPPQQLSLRVEVSPEWVALSGTFF